MHAKQRGFAARLPLLALGCLSASATSALGSHGRCNACRRFPAPRPSHCLPSSGNHNLRGSRELKRSLTRSCHKAGVLTSTDLLAFWSQFAQKRPGGAQGSRAAGREVLLVSPGACRDLQALLRRVIPSQSRSEFSEATLPGPDPVAGGPPLQPLPPRRLCAAPCSAGLALPADLY